MAPKKKLPGPLKLWFFTLITLGIYPSVYITRRWRELFAELAEIRAALGKTGDEDAE